MKKIRICLILLVAAAAFLMGCESEQKEKGYEVFYLNIDMTTIGTVEYEMQADEEAGPEAMAQELLDALAKSPEATELRQTLPKGVEVLGHSYNGYLYTVNFSEKYYSIGTVEEILVRAAVAKTLLQIPKISYVAINVEGNPLVDAKGNPVGSMGTDNFVENPEKQINSSLEAKLTLYFADKEGTALKKETRKVRYSSNISLEKLVMEQMMEGPKQKGSQPTIPTGTKLINISVMDKVCYVSLDDNFKNQNQEISEQVVLYSIVNSLAELPDVDKVQVSINGDTSGKCRFIYDLDVLYEPLEELIKTGED